MLVLVIGPPGTGKDTLLDGARRELAVDPAFRFVRRTIDQPRDQRVDTHEPVSAATFEARRAAGAFAFTWRSDGVSFGIPADIALDLMQGRTVVANVSRTVLAAAASRFPLRLIEITTPIDVLARRLAARGRADAVNLARRYARSFRPPDGVISETIENDASIEDGVRRLVAALRRAAAAALST